MKNSPAKDYLFIPNFVKPVLRPLYSVALSSRLGRKIALALYPESRNTLHQYWREPRDESNLPQNYLVGRQVRSQLLVKMIREYASPSAKILEIGCNVGRNLNYLFEAGFKNLAGIEISQKAVQLLNQAYPEMAHSARIYTAPVEEVIKSIEDGEFNVVFTMATFGHIHTESEWIFGETVRITKDSLITIEAEGVRYWGHYPRNYRKVFESLGMKQVEVIDCSKVEGYSTNHMARVFKKI